MARALTSGLPGLCAEAIRFGADPVEVDRAGRAARPPDRLVWRADVDLGDRVVRIEHPGPGHTDHDLVVVVTGEPAVVFCGDLVEESGDPAIGTDSHLADWPSSLDRLLELGGEDARYVPGHGAVVDAAFVRDQRAWLAGKS